VLHLHSDHDKIKAPAEQDLFNLYLEQDGRGQDTGFIPSQMNTVNKVLPESRRFSEISTVPILQLHRHRDGYIAFATKRDDDDFRPRVAIRAGGLESWFPAFREQFEKDSYVAINADWRLRSHGADGDEYGYPLHCGASLRYINACYVDIDFHILGLDFGTVIGRVVNLQDAGQLPHASMIVRSGQGVWLLWLLHDVQDPDLSQRAFPDKLELYRRIQDAIIERLVPLGADMAAKDAARYLRLPGSLNADSETIVEWWIQGANEAGYIYTLPELAKLFNVIPAKRHRGEIVARNPAKRRGWVALNAQRLRDFNTLRAVRGGFSDGCRNNAAKIYAWLLRANGKSKSDVLGLLTAMGEQCRPRLSRGEIKNAWKYTRLRKMRDQTISDWLKIISSESELLERFPPAGLPQLKPIRKSMASIRGSVAERRDALTAIIAELGYVPAARELSALLAQRSISASHVTVWRDIQALRAGALDPKPESQLPLLSVAGDLSFPVCNG
jgi:hypothetical protein